MFTRIVFCTSLFLAATSDVWACGACISPSLSTGSDAPVVQDAERVLFLRDPVSKISTVWVEVRYFGLAKNFAWVLPVPKLPQVGVGSVAVFDALDLRMAARLQMKTLPAENCRDPAQGCASFDYGKHVDAKSLDISASDASKASGGGDANTPDVEILSSGATGPYNFVVVKGSEANALYQWLNGNGYATPEKAKSIIASHVAKGDLFVAVKLQNGQGVTAIRPITLTMNDAEPCVPLRLTSIAAKDDMAVVVTLGGPGRAIVKNHLDVQINPLRLTPFAGSDIACSAGSGNGGNCLIPNNYAQVLATAIDGAGGNAFVTEYAGVGSATGPMGSIAATAAQTMASVKSYYELGQLLSQNIVPVTQEVADTLDSALGLSDYATDTAALQVLANLRGCAKYWQQQGNMGDHENCPLQEVASAAFTASKLKAKIVNGVALADIVQKQLIDPVAAVAKLLNESAIVTRLVMRISPSEMDRDPVFSFNPNLPTVNNVSVAQTNKVCMNGWAGSYPTGVRLTWPDLGSWVLEGKGGGIDPRFADTPAAAKIQLLDETGGALDIAPSQAEVIAAAIAGAKPGKPSLPKELLVQPPVDWTVPLSDPLVTFAGPWPRPYACVPKPGWQDGKPAPATSPSSDNGQDLDAGSRAVPGVDAAGGWAEVAPPQVGDPILPPLAVVKSDSGCAARPAQRHGAVWLVLGWALLCWRRYRPA